MIDTYSLSALPVMARFIIQKPESLVTKPNIRVCNRGQDFLLNLDFSVQTGHGLSSVTESCTCSIQVCEEDFLNMDHLGTDLLMLLLNSL